MAEQYYKIISDLIQLISDQFVSLLKYTPKTENDKLIQFSNRLKFICNNLDNLKINNQLTNPMTQKQQSYQTNFARLRSESSHPDTPLYQKRELRVLNPKSQQFEISYNSESQWNEIRKSLRQKQFKMKRVSDQWISKQ